MLYSTEDYDDFTGEIKVNGKWCSDEYEATEEYLNGCDRAYEEMINNE